MWYYNTTIHDCVIVKFFHSRMSSPEDMINRFVASYPEMKEVGAKFPTTQTPDGQSDKSDIESLSPEKRKAMTAVATKHGFRDLQEWSDVAQSVIMSYAYLREGKGLQELDKMVDQMVAQAERQQAHRRAEAEDHRAGARACR